MSCKIVALATFLSLAVGSAMALAEEPTQYVDQHRMKQFKETIISARETGENIGSHVGGIIFGAIGAKLGAPGGPVMSTMSGGAAGIVGSELGGDLGDDLAEDFAVGQFDFTTPPVSIRYGEPVLTN